MKKIYIAPTITATPVQMTEMICVSFQTNVTITYGGEAPEGFGEDNVRGKENNESSLWYDWDDIDEEE